MLIRVKNLSLAFQDKIVINRISFDIAQNEIFALMGESGSGKSLTCLSLLQLVKGATYPEGQIFYQEQNLLLAQENTLQSLRGRDISYILQEPYLNPTMPVYRQIQEVFFLHNLEDQTDDLLKSLNLTISQKSYPHELSGGQKQRVMIAIALALNPKLIIADEPTSAQDPETQKRILHLLKKFKKNASILLVSHDFSFIQSLADRIAVMKNGRILEIFSTAAVAKNPYSRLLIQSTPKGSPVHSAFQDHSSLLEVQDLNYTTPKGVKLFHNLSFCAKKGETLGMIGNTGVGKTTLAYLLVKLLKPQSGKIFYKAIDIVPLKEKIFRRQFSDIQLLMQSFGLNPRLTVQQSLNDTVFEASLYDKLGLTKELLSRFPHQLSGGQKQRIALYRVLSKKPHLLILDEPTSALDPSIQNEILLLLKELQKELGLTYLLISHDPKVIDSMSHQVLTLSF